MKNLNAIFFHTIAMLMIITHSLAMATDDNTTKISTASDGNRVIDMPRLIRHHAIPPHGHVEVTELSSCVIIGAFDPENIQREQSATGLDRIFYDLPTRDVTVLRITSFDPFGQVVFSENRNKCTPRLLHFSIDSESGNESTLQKKIRYFLKTQESYRCPKYLNCF